MNYRCPSLERVAQYVREEMIDGTSATAVMAGGGHKDRPTTLVRWRVWARLRAEGYSYPGIAKRFGVDHGSVHCAVDAIAEGRTPYRGCRNIRLPKAEPKRKRPPTRKAPALIRFAGYDPTEQMLGRRSVEPAP